MKKGKKRIEKLTNKRKGKRVRKDEIGKIEK